MKYCLVTYFDKDLESFTTLQIIPCPSWHDLTVDMSRGLKKQFPLDKLGQFAGKVMYFKGTFDDETGVVVAGDESLDLDSLLIQNKKYVEELNKAKEKAVEA